MDSESQDGLVSNDLRLAKVERLVSRFKYWFIGSVLLNAALLIVLFSAGGLNIFTRRLHTRDILLEDGNGKIVGELGVKKDWDGISTGAAYPEIRFYDDAGKTAMLTSGTGTGFFQRNASTTIGFTGITVNGKNRNILISPDTFSFANENENGSVLNIVPTQTGFDLSASANGNTSGIMVSDKYASMFVSDPHAEVDINAENGRPEINRILTNRNYVQPVH